MVTNKLFDFVYLKIISCYNEIKLDFNDLLDLVAKNAKVDHKGIPLFVDGKPCRKRTKMLIINVANSYIKVLPQIYSDINLATFTSGRQLDKLIYSFKSKKKQLSCHSAIILLSMIKICIDSNASNDDIYAFKYYISVIEKWISDVYLEKPYSTIANYILDGFNEINFVISTRSNPESLPAIPRKKLFDN